MKRRSVGLALLLLTTLFVSLGKTEPCTCKTGVDFGICQGASIGYPCHNKCNVKNTDIVTDSSTC